LSPAREGDPDRCAAGPGLRLSDRDREELAGLLARHAAEGTLSLEELEARLGSLYGSRSREEAAALISDLPPLGSPPPHRRSGRGHGEAARPDVGWVATSERFRDPSTRRIMRVWVDSSSGERHYVPDDPE
jgi:hypothetical protein